MLGITLGREWGPGGLSSAVSVDKSSRTHHMGIITQAWNVACYRSSIYPHRFCPSPDELRHSIYLQLAHRPAHLVTIKMATCKLAFDAMGSLNCHEHTSSVRMYSSVLILTSSDRCFLSNKKANSSKHGISVKYF